VSGCTRSPLILRLLLLVLHLNLNYVNNLRTPYLHPPAHLALTLIRPTFPSCPLQLDFLLGQTQKYSTMLAGRLNGEEAAAAAAGRLPPSLAPAPSGLPPTCLSGSLSGSPLPAAGAPKPKPEAAAAAVGGAGSGGDPGGQAAVRPSRRQRRPTRGVSPALPASAAASGTAGGSQLCMSVLRLKL
jgi:hypothetical protein